MLAFCAAKCNSSQHARENQQVQQVDLIELNKKEMLLESSKIDRFIRAKGWEMKKTGTGLRYMIYQSVDTNQSLAVNEQYATVNFEVRLMNGKVCYKSEENKPETFLIGRDNVESGLHEGILYMRVGEKAKFVLPPHLAHGLAGDMNKIPGNSTIVYDVELVSLK